MASILAARLGGSTAAEASGIPAIEPGIGFWLLARAEFNSVAEQAPMVLQAIAKETGKSVGELKEFAQGGITSDVVLRALKRIENEGADQLAKAMDTPQQAIKDLQNAVSLNVEVGRLVQPTVLDFVRAPGALRQAVIQMQRPLSIWLLLAAADCLGNQLQRRLSGWG